MRPPVFQPIGHPTAAQRKRESDQRRARDPANRQRRAIYNTVAWRKLRTEFLAVNPYCRACEADGSRPTLATVVDHIVPIEKGGAPFDTDNLQPLCASHHGRKTASHDGGFGHSATTAPQAKYTV